MHYYTSLLIGLEITNRSIPFQLPIQLFSECRSLCHFACIEFTLLFCCSHCTCLIVLSLLWDIGATVGCYVECCICQGHVAAMGSRTMDLQRSSCRVRPSTRWILAKFAVGFDPLSKNSRHCWIKLCHIYVILYVSVFGTSIETVHDIYNNSSLASYH